MNFSDYATTAQTAEQLGITPARVRKLCKDGKLEGAMHAGRDWLIPWQSVRKRRKAKPNKGGRPAGKLLDALGLEVRRKK